LYRTTSIANALRVTLATSATSDKIHALRIHVRLAVNVVDKATTSNALAQQTAKENSANSNVATHAPVIRARTVVHAAKAPMVLRSSACADPATEATNARPLPTPADPIHASMVASA